MTIDYETLANWRFPEKVQTYDWKDTALYALGIGLGADPMSRDELQFVYEPWLKALPTMAAVLAGPGFWIRDPGTGIDWVKILHGEQHLVLHAPLPAEGTVIGQTRVTALVDKGADKGALMYSEKTLTDTSGKLLATATGVSFLRGDGGFSANGQPSDVAPPARPATPDRAPDRVCELKTRPEAALIYRLSGDYNPVHADPDVATKAKFPQPILHGLCSFGVTGHALLATLCDYDPARLKEIGTRFSSPVYPGETLRVEMWVDGANVQFRTRVVERDIVVLSHGTAVIAA